MFIVLSFVLFIMSWRSSWALSIRMFNMKGVLLLLSCSVNMSKSGINGTEGGKSRWNYVSIKTFEKFSNFFSWICFRANSFPSEFLTQYTFPNVPFPRILLGMSCPLNWSFYELSFIFGICIGWFFITSSAEVL